MSTINELKDVLKETLEQRGILPQIRARIRAEIFNSLNDEPSEKPQLTMENMIINDLIREYMEYNHYNHSNSVFSSESGMPNEILDRQFISKKLKIVEDNNSQQMPLLYGLVFGMKKVLNKQQQSEPIPQQYKNRFPESGEVVDQGNEFEFQEDEENLDQKEMEEEINLQQLGNTSLLNDETFLQHYNQVLLALERKIVNQTIDPNHEEYFLILKSNEYSSQINREIENIHKELKDIYYKRFPELEQIILNPIEYVQIVQIIKNSVDLSKLDFSFLLNGHQVVAVNIAASSTQGQLLSEQELLKVESLCQEILNLNSFCEKIVHYIESRMTFLAPNVSALVGTELASKLMAAAGGIDKLAQMPACNIQVMGSVKKNMLGFSKAMHNRNSGFFGTLELVQKAPGKVQNQLIRMLATNVAKAARIDNLKTCPDGSIGKDLKQKMMQRYEKIQEMAPAKIEKPLPIPDENKKRKRGGRRFRKQKERLQMTEVRKYTNRLKFGLEAEDEKVMGKGLGMLSQGIGKLKVAVKKDKQIGISKKLQQRLNQTKQQSGGNTGGMTSSIVFTPTQGISLINPEQGFQSKTNDQYFNKESGFRTVLKTQQREFGQQK